MVIGTTPVSQTIRQFIAKLFFLCAVGIIKLTRNVYLTVKQEMYSNMCSCVFMY